MTNIFFSETISTGMEQKLNKRISQINPKNNT